MTEDLEFIDGTYHYLLAQGLYELSKEYAALLKLALTLGREEGWKAYEQIAMESSVIDITKIDWDKVR